MANSRMKDYYDLWILARKYAFEGKQLAEALKATFARRQTAIPEAVPVGLTIEFSTDKVKKAQWQAFLTKCGLASDRPSLEDVNNMLCEFLLPPLEAGRVGSQETRGWIPDFGWT